MGVAVSILAVLCCWYGFGAQVFAPVAATSDDAGNDLLKAFNLVDADGDGFLNKEEVDASLKSFGLGSSLENVISRADVNKDDLIDSSEWLSLNAVSAEESPSVRPDDNDIEKEEQKQQKGGGTPEMNNNNNKESSESSPDAQTPDSITTSSVGQPNPSLESLPYDFDVTEVVEISLTDGRTFRTSLVGLAFEYGFQAGYKYEWDHGYDDAIDVSGRRPLNPNSVMDVLDGIEEPYELFLPDGSRIGTLDLILPDGKTPLVFKEAFEDGVKEGLSQESGAYDKGYDRGTIDYNTSGYRDATFIWYHWVSPEFSGKHPETEILD